VRVGVRHTAHTQGAPPRPREWVGPEEDGWANRAALVVVIVLVLVLVAGLLVSIVAWGRRSPHRATPSKRTDVAISGLTPINRATWWVVLERQAIDRDWVLRTTDGGRRWRDVSPPVPLVGSSDFLDADVGWVVPTRLSTPVGVSLSSLREPLYATVDGGRRWRQLGLVPYGCQLDFVDRSHGWCAAIGAAAGSEGVQLVGTDDGGATWHPVSTTAVYPTPSTPGALPFGCDKQLSFATPTIGLATEACNGGEPVLYRSTDAGAEWAPIRLPLPPGFVPPYGDGFSTGAPVFDGSQVTVPIEFAVGGPPLPRIRVVVYRSDDDGASWHLVPLPSRISTFPDVIDAAHWITTDGTTLTATADRGRHWRTWRPDVRLVDHIGEPMRLQFLTPLVGWALPLAGGTTLTTTDGGLRWKPLVIDPERFSFGVPQLPEAAPKPA
jgi:photosystem II stability/assembly factor-like uncharacterized protein